MARRPFRSFLLVALGVIAVGLGWTETRIRREVASPLDVRNGAASARALVVFHPGLSDFPTAVTEGFAGGLVDAGWRVEVTTASMEAPLVVDAYDLLVVVAPTYWWTPARPVLRYVGHLADLQSKPAVAIVTGAGSTGRSQRILAAALRERGALVIRELSLWTMRPNKEDEYTRRTNQAVGVRLAREAGREIAPPDDATAP